MVIIVETGADEQTIQNLIDKVASLGFTPHPIHGVEKTVIAVIGHKTQEKIEVLETMPGVERIVPILQPYKLAGREVKAETTVIEVGEGVSVGGEQVVMMGGPCAVESYEQLLNIARYVKDELGKVDRPVMIKRGMSATVDDLLQAAEYVIVEGNEEVMLCERGIRTFETQTRNTLDISAVVALKRLSHLPVIADPSHASGRDWMVPALSKAAVAAGADGLLVETHWHPQEALVDGAQSLTPMEFANLMTSLRAFCEAAGRRV